ncbi:hypothetical protein [Nocardia sp. BMG51109]|uniref:hypothetical protein n=1 Tax=Nocardia sp. BMG51109 TaxID=1056816 RepID=UPI0004AF26E7|nr:hypothetical protein [Nocardia sp. BMG51109]
MLLRPREFRRYCGMEAVSRQWRTSSAPPHDWMLLDAEDGVEIYSAPNLDQIQGWLDS